MDDMLGRQPVSFGDPGFAGWATTKQATFVQQIWAGSAVDSTINPAAAQQRTVGGIDNGVNRQLRNIGFSHFHPVVWRWQPIVHLYPITCA
jgi:hypothetical protein